VSHPLECLQWARDRTLATVSSAKPVLAETRQLLVRGRAQGKRTWRFSETL